MPNISNTLNLRRWPDLQRLSQGYVAAHRPENGRYSYDVAVNDPLPEEQIEKIVEFGAGANATLIRDLFSLCNGLWVCKFAVYGLRSGPYGLQQPWDINVPNLWGRPKALPEPYLIVGTCTEKSQDAVGRSFEHCIDNDDAIVVVANDDPTAVVRRYRSISEWLVGESERALSQMAGILK